MCLSSNKRDIASPRHFHLLPWSQQCGDPSEAGGWEARPQLGSTLLHNVHIGLGINCTVQCAHWPGDQLHCTNVKCTHCTVVHCNALYIGVERWGSQYMDEILFLASFTLHTHTQMFCCNTDMSSSSLIDSISNKNNYHISHYILSKLKFSSHLLV